MTKLSSNDINQNTKMYDLYFDRFHMENGWLPGNQQINFSLMLRLTEFTGVPISGTSCLDVGCGTGDFSAILRQHGAKKYVGIDIYDTSLQKARQKYPDETFLQDDFLAHKFTSKFDYAFCSGALTVKLLDTNNYDFLQEAIQKMWDITRIGLVFNVLTDEDSFVDPDLFFYKRTKVEEICSQIAAGGHTISEKTPGDVFQIHLYMYRDSPQVI
jgi:SAM-dependent methyltransferase